VPAKGFVLLRGRNEFGVVFCFLAFPTLPVSGLVGERRLAMAEGRGQASINTAFHAYSIPIACGSLGEMTQFIACERTTDIAGVRFERLSQFRALFVFVACL